MRLSGPSSKLRVGSRDFCRGLSLESGMEPNSQVTIFYDGLCPLCSREIEHYRKRAGSDVQFVDIVSPGFDAGLYGLDPDRIHKVMHVKVGDDVRTGLDAFIAIWRVMPGYGWMAKVANLPVIRQVLTVGYHGFAAIRPFLPRRKTPLCETGVCQR